MEGILRSQRHASRHEKRVIPPRLIAAGYDCDFEAAAILQRIRLLGGTADKQGIKSCKFRFSRDSEALERKLREMVSKGLLTVSFEPGLTGPGKELFTIVESDAENF